MDTPDVEHYEPAPVGFRTRVSTIFDNVPGRSWTWIVVKVLATVWMIRYMTNTPQVTHDILGDVLQTTFLIASFGSVLSIVGMFISAQPKEWTHRNGPLFEIVGLLLLVSGPLIYASTQLWIVIVNTIPMANQREGLVWMGLTLASVFVVRIIELFPTYLKSNRG